MADLGIQSRLRIGLGPGACFGVVSGLRRNRLSDAGRPLSTSPSHSSHTVLALASSDSSVSLPKSTSSTSVSCRLPPYLMVFSFNTANRAFAASRLTYTFSTASWSIVGHVDRKTGATLHYTPAAAHNNAATCLFRRVTGFPDERTNTG